MPAKHAHALKYCVTQVIYSKWQLKNDDGCIGLIDGRKGSIYQIEEVPSS